VLIRALVERNEGIMDEKNNIRDLMRIAALVAKETKGEVQTVSITVDYKHSTVRVASHLVEYISL